MFWIFKKDTILRNGNKCETAPTLFTQWGLYEHQHNILRLIIRCMKSGLRIYKHKAEQHTFGIIMLYSIIFYFVNSSGFDIIMLAVHLIPVNIFNCRL